MTKNQGRFVVILPIGILLLARGNFYFLATAGMSEWDYELSSVKDEDFVPTLRQWGAQGREIASARRAISKEGSESTGIYECIMKRKKS